MNNQSLESHKPLVYFIYHPSLIEACDNIPNIKRRAAIVNSLIMSYKLHEKVNLCFMDKASDEDIISFHSLDYVKLLTAANNSNDLEKFELKEDIENFNLGFDCPLFPKIYDVVKIICGATLTAAKQLTNHRKELKNLVRKHDVEKPRSYLKLKSLKTSGSNSLDVVHDFSFEEPVSTESLHCVAINWQGGWHHAQRDSAEGFCYANDIVIAILHLLKYYKKVLYIDLDIHHGNGVENAFASSNRVFTFSIHKKEFGFYPGTGDIDDIGLGNGLYHTVNVPLKGGASDKTFTYVFKLILKKIISKFPAECVVLQCGADVLPGDRLGGFNVTCVGMGDCVKEVMQLRLPTLVLGGGGYNLVNVAKCWTHLTSIIVGEEIEDDIPVSCPFYLNFGPDYRLSITPSARKDENTQEYLAELVDNITKNLNNISIPVTSYISNKCS